jgi:hypothetical protein
MIDKHLPDPEQGNRLLRRERAAHIFNDEATLDRAYRDDI